MVTRSRPIGAELVDGGAHFRVWAPARESVNVVIDGREHALAPDDGGYFDGLVANARAGTRYRFRLDDDDATYPDPASRFQPDGPHGASMVIDPTYAWTDDDRRGLDAKGQVLYEMHVGTYTREGTYRAAMAHFDELRDIGVTVIELMPVSEFPGRFGWGYDGVDPWAPSHLYGTPDDLRLFVDTAHRTGLGVILDVVYNHFGPDGCYLSQFSPAYFTKRYENEWGDAVNFDGDGAEGTREFVSENAGYWIDEFHLDGLRLDATQSIIDNSGAHVVAQIARRARAAARGKSILLIGENESQLVEMIERNGLDALWNDDWHHSAMVATIGRREAYYTDYRGTPQEFISMAKYGFLFQGQWYSWQKHRRGTPSRHIAPHRFVSYLQNHDQVANSARGLRLHQLTSPGRFRAMTALLLLGPHTPLLFQGQELGAASPFLYFADHKPELAEAVAKGRREFLTQFPSIDVERTAPPDDEATFLACKLDHGERNEEIVALHHDLLRLRRDLAFSATVDGAVLGAEAFVLRFGDERLLIINLGPDLRMTIVNEPLLAPPSGKRWELLWASGDTVEPEREDGWWIAAETALVMAAK